MSKEHKNIRFLFEAIGAVLAYLMVLSAVFRFDPDFLGRLSNMSFSNFTSSLLIYLFFVLPVCFGFKKSFDAGNIRLPVKKRSEEIY